MSASWQRLARLWFARSDFLAYAWDLAAPTPEGLPVGATVRPAQPVDFPRLAAFTQHPEFQGARLEPHDVARRHQMGEVCFLAEWRGELASVSWTWFADASLRVWGVDVPLRPGEAYITWAFTLPAYRGRGLGTAVILAQLRWLRARGFQAAFLWVSPHNDAMLRILRRSRWQPVGRVVQLLWRGKTYVPLLNLSAVRDPADSLSFCASGRLSFAGGLSIFRCGPVAWFPDGAAPPGQRRTPAVSPGGGVPALRSPEAE